MLGLLFDSLSQLFFKSKSYYIGSSHIYVEPYSKTTAESCIRCLTANFDIDSIMVIHRSIKAAKIRMKMLDKLIVIQQYCCSRKLCAKMHLIEN